MIRKILVATDESKHAQKAVAVAGEMAGVFSARLVIVHTLMRDAANATLRKLATLKDLTKEQRHLLDTYEADSRRTIAQAGGMGLGVLSLPAPVEVLEPIGRQILGRAEKAAYAAGAKQVSVAILGGDPADAILKKAKREKVDLIVLGTRGYGDLKSMVLGSVSHKIAAQAHCPVLTVK